MRGKEGYGKEKRRGKMERKIMERGGEEGRGRSRESVSSGTRA